MLPLAEFQRRMRHAVVDGDVTAMAPLLHAGGRDAARRADIHRRHYQTSLVAALMGRFPATAWLVGSPVVEAAAAGFVRARPPAVPCIAEYGEGFPAWLAGQMATGQVPYVEAFAALDWQLGRLAVSADGPALAALQMAALPPDALADTVLALQDGAYYTTAEWPIDALMKVFLGERTGAIATVEPEPVWLEARGSRGVVSIARLSAAEWAFRHAIQLGLPIGVAAEQAWHVDARCDPGVALASLFTAGLVTAIGSLEGKDS